MPPRDVKAVATNRQAWRNYDILETVECGVVLQGSEVKSLREAKVQLSDAYVRIIGREVWLVGLHISPYSHSHGANGHLLDRDRKLLLRREEIDRLKMRVDLERLALVPVSIYFKDGRAKVEVALGRGRQLHDKRQAIATRDAERETRRATVRTSKGDVSPGGR